eukprot:COSAG05_NODE_296_length_11959_cov_17.897639_1_plen_509_part_00
MESRVVDYVLLPSDGSKPPQQLQLMIGSKGGDADALPTELAAAFGGTDETGGSASTEVFALLRPADHTRHEFISAYGGPGLLSAGGEAEPNWRATALAMELGFHNTRLHGDVYLGRLLRPPGAMVTRRNGSFTLEDLRPGASWQADAVIENYMCTALLSSFATSAGVATTAVARPSLHWQHATTPAATEGDGRGSSSSSSSSGERSEDSDSSSEGGGSVLPPTDPAIVARVRTELIQLYTQHKPKNVKRVDLLLERFAGIELEFLEDEKDQLGRPAAATAATTAAAGGSSSAANGQQLPVATFCGGQPPSGQAAPTTAATTAPTTVDPSPAAAAAPEAEEEQTIGSVEDTGAVGSTVGQCYGCHATVRRHAAEPARYCRGCGSVLWCSEACETARGWPHAAAYCASWREYSAAGRQSLLSGFPFPWATELAGTPCLGERPYAAFLRARGLVAPQHSGVPLPPPQQPNWWSVELKEEGHALQPIQVEVRANTCARRETAAATLQLDPVS